MLRAASWLALVAACHAAPSPAPEVVMVAPAGDAGAPIVVAAPEAAPPEPTEGPAEVALDDEPAAPAASSATPGCAPFDRGAAARALGAMNLSGCANGQSGRGHFKVVFAPDGGAKAYTIDPPFAGTPAGACIASRVRGLRIPPFCGAPVTVGKSFSLP